MNLRGWMVVVTLFTVIIGASLIIGTLIVANTIDYVKTLDSSLLIVTGSAQQIITSDEVKWTSTFSRETPANDLKGGYTHMKNDLTLVSRYLSSQGVSPKEITISPVMMTPVYNNCGSAIKFGVAPNQGGCVNEIVSYRLVQNVEVNSSDVNRITKAAQDSSALIDQGVIFSTQRLEYYYTKLPDLRVKLLVAATKDAQTRAEQIAASAGEKLGHLMSESSGVFQITPVNSTQISDVGMYDTSTIEKKITAVVRASFTLNH
ncbi:MAG: SIMPL domain-containing protein [Chloroflexi bacterium]|nr:SIMPL domain-containing protein [Chloroflexota bacterium]MCL5076160.1 SIMPL domain-containing protein [Chloroflexota bacterium]